MRFWWREIVGWLLLVLGIATFGLAIQMLNPRQTIIDGDRHLVAQVVEAGQVIVIGIVLFRGGIHLLKVAVAARICLLAQENRQGDKETRRQGDKEH